MPHEKVQSSITVPVSSDQVWSVLRNFHGTWHPAIESIWSEQDDTGRLLRAFTVHGDDATYRERLSWFSDSDRSLAYTHVEGIANVQDYTAQLSVSSQSKSECTVVMSAQLVAPAPRAEQIAAGTKAIFDDGLRAIKKNILSTTQVAAPQIAAPQTTPIPDDDNVSAQYNTSLVNNTLPITQVIDGSPALSVSYIEGPNKHTLCLFLHGIGGNKSNWRNQLKTIAPFCTAAAMDLRGYGDSELGEAQSTIDDYCDDILRVANAFSARKLILCGLSYGAWIATSFAVRHPARLSGLVLSGGCTGMSEAADEERDAFRRSREVPMKEGKTPADFASDVVAVLAGPDISDSVKQELLSSMSAIASETYADALRCFTNPTERFDFSLITVPVLLMTGSADKLAPPDEIKQVAQRIHNAATNPDVRFECLHRAGHVCNLEANDAYNDPLVSLVSRLVQ